jgi:hypothetical protein
VSYGLQRIVPDYVRGLILALDLGVVSLTISVSSLAAGRLADMGHPRVVMAGLAAVEVAYGLGFAFFTRKLRAKPGPKLPPQCEASATELQDSMNSAVIMTRGIMVHRTSIARTLARPGDPAGRR